jgi:hypothetical protein
MVLFYQTVSNQNLLIVIKLTFDTQDNNKMGCKRPQFTKSISKFINDGLMVNFRNKWRIKRVILIIIVVGCILMTYCMLPFFNCFITTKQWFYVDFLTNFSHIRHLTKKSFTQNINLFYINLTKFILIDMIKND